ncbi:MAG TPA: hypothetical protein VNI55_09050 [Gaiellaceae bacterium]|nr:hypothetical protein [Gaiellaceae bacterium]
MLVRHPVGMALAEELDRVAEAAAALATAGEELAAVLATEAHPGARLYLCAFETEGGDRSWLGLDEDAQPVAERHLLRDAISIAALCEVAEEVAVGGDLDDLLAQLVSLRMTENPDGIEEAEAAVLDLQQVLGAPPSLATPARLDAIGLATRRLELALGGATQGSPFADAMRGAGEVVDSLTADVERSYRAVLR